MSLEYIWGVDLRDIHLPDIVLWSILPHCSAAELILFDGKRWYYSGLLKP